MTRRRSTRDAVDQPITALGVVYRTRLHARWGVAFETLGLPTRYRREDERFADGLLIPDFWLASLGRYLSVVRGEPKTDVCIHATRVQERTGYPAFVLCCFPVQYSSRFRQPGWPRR